MPLIKAKRLTLNKIDRVRETDLEELSLLYEEFWGEKSSLEKMKLSLQEIENDNRYLLLVAKIEEKIVGSVMGVLCKNLYGQCKPILVVEDVIVSKNFRRRGIGKKLRNYIP